MVEGCVSSANNVALNLPLGFQYVVVSLPFGGIFHLVHEVI